MWNENTHTQPAKLTKVQLYILPPKPEIQNQQLTTNTFSLPLSLFLPQIYHHFSDPHYNLETVLSGQSPMFIPKGTQTEN